MRSALLMTALALGFAAGCREGKTNEPRAKMGCCDCQMWGVMGMDPGPDYVAPPRPKQCDRVMSKPACRKMDCPAPP